jgi:hypothetical protein
MYTEKYQHVEVQRRFNSIQRKGLNMFYRNGKSFTGTSINSDLMCRFDLALTVPTLGLPRAQRVRLCLALMSDFIMLWQRS